MSFTIFTKEIKKPDSITLILTHYLGRTIYTGRLIKTTYQMATKHYLNGFGISNEDGHTFKLPELGDSLRDYDNIIGHENFSCAHVSFKPCSRSRLFSKTEWLEVEYTWEEMPIEEIEIKIEENYKPVQNRFEIMDL